MDVDPAAVPLVGIFFYLLLFPFLSVPNIIFSILLSVRLRKDVKYSRLRYLPLLFPILGVMFYLTVDYFESIHQSVIWFAVLALISLMPAALYIGLKRKTKAVSRH